jgi:tetratricopeptide (TPR) repeat protein
VLMGDSRRLFANHFFVKADAYFHSGFYPSIFDNREAFQTAQIGQDAGVMAAKNTGDEHDFMGPPRDWIERFGRGFFPSTHSHIDQPGAHGHRHDHDHGHHHHHDHGHAHAHPPGELGQSGDVREILPWLRFSASLDPQRVATYTTASYWLRQRMKKVDEAEQFLREGLNSNPQSPDILFELGRLYAENRQDATRARNLWELGARYWREQADAGRQPDEFTYLQTIASLAMLEEKEGNLAKALEHTRLWKTISPNPDEIQKRIDELQAKLRP